MGALNRTWVVGILGAALLALGACKTSQPGVENRFGAITTNVAAEPPRVTEAAEEALEELNLRDISARSTQLDGQVTGYTAQGTKINIDINRAGDNASSISIRAGTVGDEALSLSILQRVQNNLE